MTPPTTPPRPACTLLPLLRAAAGQARVVPADRVEHALGSLPAFGGRGHREPAAALAGVIEGLLDVDLGAAALAGWRTHEELLTAARWTTDVRGVTEIVDLSDRLVVATWHPAVDVRLGDAHVARLPVQLEVRLRAVGVFATVTRGRLTRIGGGRCEVTALLSMHGRPLAEHTVPVDTDRLVIRLGAGITLPVEDPSAA